MNKLNYLNAKVAEQSELLEVLLKRNTIPEANTTVDVNITENIFKLFPLKDNIDLTQVEEFLELKDNFLALVRSNIYIIFKSNSKTS